MVFCLWGILIVGSNRFYAWWRDRFWIEPNDGHLSKEALLYNRYIEGGSEVVIGVALIYVSIFN